MRRTSGLDVATDPDDPISLQESLLNQDRTSSRHVPPEPGDPAKANPSTVDNSDKAKDSPAFREALKNDDAREAHATFSVDKDLWGRSGAGPDVSKSDPEDPRKTEPQPKRREEGYGE